MKNQRPVLGTVAREGVEQPLLTSREVPYAAYGDSTAITFAEYARTSIPEGRVFTADFASRVYTSIWRASTLAADRHELANCSAFCLWLKNNIESLDSNNPKLITEFLGNLNQEVKKLLELEGMQQLSSDANHVQFVLTVVDLERAIRSFVSSRLPKLLLPVDSSSDFVVPTTELETPLQQARANKAYLQTALPTGSLLFSAAFANSVYEQLISMSQIAGKTVVYSAEICGGLKAKIESAKTVQEVIDLMRFLNAAIDNTGHWYDSDDNLDSVFVRTLKDIREKIFCYLGIAHSNVVANVDAALRRVQAERTSEFQNCAGYACWTALCGVNAIAQLPLNMLWPVINIATLCIPEMVASHCGVSNMPDCINGDGSTCVTLVKAIFLPVERAAFSQKREADFWTPMASTAQNAVNLWNSGGHACEKRALASEHQVVADHLHQHAPQHRVMD